MRKGLWHKKSPVVIAGILCAVLGVGALLPGKLAHTHADEGTCRRKRSAEMRANCFLQIRIEGSAWKRI